ncbi:hypothetical protein CYY_006364 [Polysphondylium violaceum]|uniref:Ankyrin repeat-containing protein n=1 Tax=Polysphondylium violaceum TaxID=133409 RepID=A0A8J4UY90_9MYCE|nr:hypothetical protein CYY_006364 [Polysphondylium violaceum]
MKATKKKLMNRILFQQIHDHCIVNAKYLSLGRLCRLNKFHLFDLKWNQYQEEYSKQLDINNVNSSKTTRDDLTRNDLDLEYNHQKFLDISLDDLNDFFSCNRSFDRFSKVFEFIKPWAKKNNHLYFGQWFDLAKVLVGVDERILFTLLDHCFFTLSADPLPIVRDLAVQDPFQVILHFFQVRHKNNIHRSLYLHDASKMIYHPNIEVAKYFLGVCADIKIDYYFDQLDIEYVEIIGQYPNVALRLLDYPPKRNDLDPNSRFIQFLLDNRDRILVGKVNFANGAMIGNLDLLYQMAKENQPSAQDWGPSANIETIDFFLNNYPDIQFDPDQVAIYGNVETVGYICKERNVIFTSAILNQSRLEILELLASMKRLPLYQKELYNDDDGQDVHWDREKSKQPTTCLKVLKFHRDTFGEFRLSKKKILMDAVYHQDVAMVRYLLENNRFDIDRIIDSKDMELFYLSILNYEICDLILPHYLKRSWFLSYSPRYGGLMTAIIRSNCIKTVKLLKQHDVTKQITESILTQQETINVLVSCKTRFLCVDILKIIFQDVADLNIALLAPLVNYAIVKGHFRLVCWLKSVIDAKVASRHADGTLVTNFQFFRHTYVADVLHCLCHRSVYHMIKYIPSTISVSFGVVCPRTSRIVINRIQYQMGEYVSYFKANIKLKQYANLNMLCALPIPFSGVLFTSSPEDKRMLNDLDLTLLLPHAQYRIKHLFS